MKYLKMLGLAAVAAMALAAFAGASSASASSVLCKTNETPCALANHIVSGSAIEASSSNATLTSSLGDIVCSSSGVAGATTTTGSSKTNVEGNITSLTFGGCVLHTPVLLGGGEHSCTVESVNITSTAPAKASVTGSGGNGTMTITPGTLGNPGAHAKCGENGSVMNCTFQTKKIELDVTGGSPAHVTASEEELERTANEGGVCPSSSKWDATYEVTKPNPLWVVAS